MSRSSKVTDANNEKSENPVYRFYDSDNPAFERSQSIHSIQSNKSRKSKTKPKEPNAVSIGKLFSLATRGDVVMIIIALIMSLGTGICWPLIILVFGTTASSMADYQYYVYSLTAFLTTKNIPNLSSMTVTDMESIASQLNFTTKFPNFIFNTMSTMSQYFAGIALGMFLLSYISVTFLVITSQHQISVMRNAFFTALMRQNIGWFDEQTSGALNNKLIDDINTVHAGIGDKVGQMVLWFSCCIAGIILAFVNGWKLTLVILSISPLIVICMIMLAKFMMTLTQKVSEAYGKAGGIAEEVLGAVRTVVSFRGEKYEVNRYTENLDDACKTGIRKSILTGTLLGLVQGLLFASYALGFWYGANLIRTEANFTVGNMLIIFFSSLMATMGLGNATPHLGSLNESRKAVAGIFNIIDRVPEIDKMSKTGKKLEDFRGKITFNNAVFNYPTRTDVPVLTGLSLSIEPGQTVALVGASGCGKSSLIQLIQRFYDLNNGEVLIDDVNIKDFNVMWLREQIGVVSQEPVLFGCTIKENIRYGRMDVTDEEIDNALVMANAKTFVESLPNKLDTLVGDRGTQLSGGQKQRIAIARALVRNPKILLLDEATSALDSESEKIVQDALDKVVEGRTTVIVAHRLSTVRNANIIFGIKDGKVLEKGTHEELINLNGLYKELVDRQKIDQEKEENLTGKDIKETSELSPTKSLTRKKSIVEKAEEIKEELKEDAKKNSAGVLRVLKLNQPEIGYIFLGCISSIFNGAVQPSFSILFGYLLPAMANPDLKKQESEITIYVIALAGLAVVVFVSSVLQNVGFGKSGENLTKRCRSVTFEAMLRQDISWFDDPKNNIGALTTRLSDEASQIRGISGESFGSILTAVCSLGAAVVISFAFCWQISLVVLAFVPIIFVGGILQIRITQGFSRADKGALEESGKIAVECIENVRTVSNLTREQTFIQHYKEAIEKLDGEVSKKAHIQGLLFGITQAAIFCAYAATFVLAGYLLQNNKTEMKNVFISFGALIFGAMNLGKSMAMAPNFGKGKQAAANMFELLDRVPPINSSSSDGAVLDILNTPGCIDIENVKFAYPLRPNIVILNNVSFNIKPNKTVALVGPSGCGKSTIIGLLQRFYDIQEGNMKIDNNKITDINIKNLRQLFSIVSQEPTLFSYSIRENIAYSDMENIFTDDQIIEAAKASNIHDFISNLPDKYDTKVGEKGSNFSGGQKQRIAIARALLRNPKVLLLDEATSALDTESEKVVQEALDKAQEGRTCVVIAHRLSTIQNSDKIIVFKEANNSIDLSASTNKKTHDKTLSSSESDRSSLTLSPNDKYQHMNNRGQQDDHTSEPSSVTGGNSVDNTILEDSQIYSMKRVVGLSRTNLPFQARKILFGWLTSHLREPYPSEEEKIRLANETGLSRTTVNNWFINARRRYVKPLLQGKLGMTSGVLKSMLENNNGIIHNQRNQFATNIMPGGIKRKNLLNNNENDNGQIVKRRANSNSSTKGSHSRIPSIDSYHLDGNVNIKTESESYKLSDNKKSDFISQDSLIEKINISDIHNYESAQITDPKREMHAKDQNIIPSSTSMSNLINSYSNLPAFSYLEESQEITKNLEEAAVDV